MAYIEVRQAQPEDREAVLAFCRDTWEWSSYIEHAWSEWLNDPDGRLFVATVEGYLAGVVHVSMVTKTDAWLEGMHVDPQFRQQGVARALNDAALLEAMQRGAKYARLQIRSDNTRAQEFVTQAHFRQVSTFTLFQATPLKADLGRRQTQEKPRLATLDDLDTIIDFLNASNIFPLVGGLYYARFKAYPITVELLEEKIAAQQVSILYRWDRLDGLAIAEVCNLDGAMRLAVGYIDGTAIEPISLLAYDLRRRLNELELERLCVYAPDLVLIRDAFTGVGYEWDAKIFYTYERGLE
jgi:GNAT superfamily N-acetyltransferase